MTRCSGAAPRGFVLLSRRHHHQQHRLSGIGCDSERTLALALALALAVALALALDYASLGELLQTSRGGEGSNGIGLEYTS